MSMPLRPQPVDHQLRTNPLTSVCQVTYTHAQVFRIRHGVCLLPSHQHTKMKSLRAMIPILAGAVSLLLGAPTPSATAANKKWTELTGTVPGVSVAGSTLHAASLTWNGGGELDLALGTASDQLALTGALTKGTAGAFALGLTP